MRKQTSYRVYRAKQVATWTALWLSLAVMYILVLGPPILKLIALIQLGHR